MRRGAVAAGDDTHYLELEYATLASLTLFADVYVHWLRPPPTSLQLEPLLGAPRGRPILVHLNASARWI